MFLRVYIWKFSPDLPVAMWDLTLLVNEITSQAIQSNVLSAEQEPFEKYLSRILLIHLLIISVHGTKGGFWELIYTFIVSLDSVQGFSFQLTDLEKWSLASLFII
jgi:hypothetical protein